jgi:hypothetical protein
MLNLLSSNLEKYPEVFNSDKVLDLISDLMIKYFSEHKFIEGGKNKFRKYKNKTKKQENIKIKQKTYKKQQNKKI